MASQGMTMDADGNWMRRQSDDQPVRPPPHAADVAHACPSRVPLPLPAAYTSHVVKPLPGVCLCTIVQEYKLITEYAKSGRASCGRCSEKIGKDEVRVGRYGIAGLLRAVNVRRRCCCHLCTPPLTSTTSIIWPARHLGASGVRVRNRWAMPLPHRVPHHRRCGVVPVGCRRPIKWGGGCNGFISSWQHMKCIRLTEDEVVDPSCQIYGMGVLKVVDQKLLAAELKKVGIIARALAALPG